jgi:hypothetical protein
VGCSFHKIFLLNTVIIFMGKKCKSKDGLMRKRSEKVRSLKLLLAKLEQRKRELATRIVQLMEYQHPGLIASMVKKGGQR